MLTTSRRSMAALLILLVAATTLFAQEDSGQFDYRETVLDNGLRVITMEDFSCPIVAVNLWYHVGSKDEDPERQGFAHMFEHMMFRGTDRLGPTDHFDLIRKTGGQCNAYTTFDQTVYHEVVPANQLDLALWLEAERMAFLKIDQDAFDTERKVVEEERRMGANKPYGKLMEKALPILFPGHPYRWSTIGSIPHLRASSVPELREFWTKYYVPNNATLVIVGAVSHDEALKKAQRYFGWIPKYEPPPRVDRPSQEPFDRDEVVIKEQNAPTPLVGLVFRGVPLDHPDYLPLQIMTTILGGGESSRLYRRIVIDDESAMVAAAGALALEQNGIVGIGGVLPPLGGDPEVLVATIREEIVKMQGEPVSEAELAKARNQMLRSLVTRNLTVESKAAALGSATVLEGDVGRVNAELENIRNVSTEDVQRVAREYLNQDNEILVRVDRNLLGSLGSLLGFGDNEDKAPITGEPETSPPPPGRPGLERPSGYRETPPIAQLLDYDPSPKFETAELDNGLRSLIVENHEIPFVSVQLGLRSGAFTEDHPGTATMAMSMLTKGTHQRSEKELAEELETYAVSLGGSAGRDSASISMTCLTDQLPRGMALLGDVVLDPTMPEAEFNRLKKQQITNLTVSINEPAYLADRELRKRLYGDHPYARSTTGEIEDLESLQRDDCLEWWRKHARPDNATLVFAGDISAEEAVRLAQEYLGSWKAPSSQLKDVAMAAPPAIPSTHIYLLDHPGVQSEIRVAQPGFTRDDPDYFVGRVVSSYFGGAFNSRLNETIRVKKGLTYGARGGFGASRFAGQFNVSTFSKNESAVEAVQAILDEIERLRSEPPSDEELETTKSYTVGSFPSGRETPQQVAGELWSQDLLGLPTDYYQQLLNGVAAATADDCLRVAQSRIDPSQLIIVVVGPKQLASDLEKIAPVTIVE